MSRGSMGGGANMRAPYRWRLWAARKRQGLRGTNAGCDSSVLLADGDQRDASFDKLRMRVFLRVTKVDPHPELVEGRTIAMHDYRGSLSVLKSKSPPRRGAIPADCASPPTMPTRRFGAAAPTAASGGGASSSSSAGCSSATGWVPPSPGAATGA